MKYLYTVLIAVLFSSIGFSQCIADAGPDQHYCSYLQTTDTITLGGQPAGSGGTSPYIYKWSFVNDPASVFKIKASHLLNDTTVANPEFYGSGLGDSLTFVLEVVDGNSISCFDTVVITESVFVSHLGQYGVTVTEGDTITFPFGTNIMSNLPVKSYLWRPNHGMIDSTSLNPTLAPTKSMAYHVVITDSAGCVAKGGDFVFVTVNPIGLDEPSLSGKIDLYPNPVKDRLQISFSAEFSSANLVLTVTDVSGRIIDKFTHHGDFDFSESIQLKNGLYNLEIFKDGVRVSHKKFVVQN